MPINQDMNGNRFRLERVRALREDRESAAKQNLAGAMAQQSECAERLHSTETMIDDARAASRHEAAHASGAELLAHQVYVERLERNKQTVIDELKRRAGETERRRGALRIASQDRQALERLKTKTLIEQRRQVAHREQQLLDEVAANGYRRRSA